VVRHARPGVQDVDLRASLEIGAPDTEARWHAYVACRVRNLYEPYGLPSSCALSELDAPRDRPDVLHRMIMDGVQVVGVARLDLRPAEIPPECAARVSQLRYFAVDAARRGSGVGMALLHAMERASVERGRPMIWMDAREEAVPFYARCGYADIGPGPTKWGVIPHRKMMRALA